MFLFLTLTSVNRIAGADEWDDADRDVRRINPSEFHWLPTKIIEKLEK